MKINIYLFLLISYTVLGQDYGILSLVTTLPNTLSEISGIEKFPDEEYIWTINDSRNPPEVYAYHPFQKKKVQTIRAKNATNIDWEDLATSPDGTLFIGDFGNNISNRTDLTIYALQHPSKLEKRRAEPIVTTFAFEDHEKFPPKRKDISFDAEAFIFLNNHFYIFTRNRAKKYDGTTRIYKLPAKEGHFTAELIGIFETGEDQKDCEITAATIHHPTGKIALLSYNKVWVFCDYTGDDFVSGKVEKIKLQHTSQKESICFVSENTLYIADEYSRKEGRNLYQLNLN